MPARATTWHRLAPILIFAVTALLTPVVLRGAAASDPPRLLVIGDSVLLGAKDQILNALPGWHVEVDAAVSRSTHDGLAVLAAHGTNYDVVVVQLGTNDGGTPGVYEPRVAAMLDALAPVPTVYWLTIREARSYYAATNEIIRGQVAAHPNAHVGDWNARSQPADVAGDGLHLTPTGAASMSAFVAELASGKAPAAPPATNPPPTAAPAEPPVSPDTTVAVEPSTTTTPGTTSTTSQATSTTSTTRAAASTAVASTTVPVATRPDSDGSGVPWPALAAVAVVAGGVVAFAVARSRRHAPDDGDPDDGDGLDGGDPDDVDQGGPERP